MLSLALLVLLLYLASTPTAGGFQINHRTLVIGRSRPSIHLPQENHVNTNSFAFKKTVSLQSQKSNGDGPKPEGTTNIQDGSPLGVAIVCLGGGLVTFGGDNFSDIPIWAVLIAASTAAGVERFLRYLRDQ
eukprot:CAMPEP_0113299644 /NCGR_PEP_ID=MMETSP0010_2-20120614/1595_1 /TAXON_ID=216773 ORGANISM="Corethron hystrix, Strain 308" /NCGR_SAMPLE_ID=MMETSP0010_2 /ASSEMBLY_ACC=CAM_ASM_000155 /LENGTH=130 /DNA_ID=CAMNT_0000152917 /DNA_START=1379 /DNA_END=1771 /DNA_ORIENTATION=+ /assembly_acc=CAM_ASM_000155